MEQKNQFISLSYQLFLDGEDGQEMVEEATAERPFEFISGFGVALDAFESQVVNLEKEDTFDFLIPKEQAYGDYNAEHVLELKRDTFFINGRFDDEHIYPEAIIPLQNEEGQRFYGRVVEIGNENVKVDLNHPLAGETLHFVGRVLENRPATTKEIEQLVKHLTGGCGGHCGDCNGCGEGNCGEGQCDGGCSHCH